LIGRRIVVLLIATVALVVAGCAGSGSNKAGGTIARKPLVLTLANPLGDSEEVDGFASEVRRLSNGAMRIYVEDRWRYGQVAFEDALIGDVRAGKADLGIAGSRAWDSVGVMSMRALGAPFLIASYALQERVLRSPLIVPMLKGLAPLGLVGLGVLPGPLRYPFGVVRPLLGPSDYARLRIGLQPSPVGSATLRALGATPVGFAVGAPIVGLGGVEQQISSVQNQYYRVARYLTANVVLWPRPLVLFANRNAFAKLTRTQQRILMQAAEDDVAPETRMMQEAQRISTAALCHTHRLRFVTASSADLAALERAVQPVYAMLYRDPRTRAQIAAIGAMRRRNAPEPAVRCPRFAPAGAAKGPLDGVYQFTVSFADLQAAGADPGELLPENVGKMTFVFDKGRFAFTQEYPQGQSCTWGYGTLTIKRDTLTQLFTDGGGMAPGNATNKPGEDFTFDWSLYRDILTLHRLKGTPPGTVPTADFAKPWRRVSTTPSRRYFSKRCPPPANALPS